MSIPVRVKILPAGLGLPLPEYQSAGSAGLDLMAAIPADSTIVIEPHARELVPTGLAVEIPVGYEAQVRPRSGLAIRHGITVLNTPGTIDSDYRGEIGVILINLGSEPFTLARGERIAQLIFAAVARAEFIEVQELDQTTRGAGGFGSTGVATATKGGTS